MHGFLRKTMKLLAKANHIFERIINSLAIVAGVLIAFMMFGIATDVGLRTFWNRPIPWMVEVVEYCLLWMTFLSAAWLLEREGHVKMGILLDRLKPRTQTLVNIVTSIIGVVACAILVWYTAENTLNYFQTGHVLPTQRRFIIYPIFVIIPIGGALISIQFLRRAHGYLKSWRGLPVQEQRTQVTL